MKTSRSIYLGSAIGAALGALIGGPLLAAVGAAIGAGAVQWLRASPSDSEGSTFGAPPPSASTWTPTPPPPARRRPTSATIGEPPREKEHWEKSLTERERWER